MLHQFFKIFFRNAFKNKINFVFKLAGLSIAWLSILVIALYITFQLSFDRFHEGYEHIYRINTNRDEDGKMQAYATVPQALGPALKTEFPEVKALTRIGAPGSQLIRYNDKSFRFSGLVSADNSIFDVLTFRFLIGDAHALDKPGSIVLTKSVARQIFG